jgi:hypothetical protein
MKTIFLISGPIVLGNFFRSVFEVWFRLGAGVAYDETSKDRQISSKKSRQQYCTTTA